MKKISIRLSADLPRKPSQIWVGDRILENNKLLNFDRGESQNFVIADVLLKKQTQRFCDHLKSQGKTVHLRYVKADEKLKDLNHFYPLYEWLLKKGANRSSTLVAVGGGTVGDAVGFLAGTYMRGVSWVGVPTTLLAQVDSCIGGKTGLNHPLGKNLIGVFHSPTQVLCDVSWLSSLPSREIVSGLGEMIKYGLLFDPSLFQNLRQNWKKILDLDSQTLTQTVSRCLKWKAQVVEKDPEDRLGVREVLNLGHTLGHALEAELGYGQLRHGEAVIFGMRIALSLSVARGHLAAEKQKAIEAFLKELPLPRLPSSLFKTPQKRKLIERLKWDKKNRNGKTRFVLLKDIGKSVLDSEVSSEEILQAIGAIQ